MCFSVGLLTKVVGFCSFVDFCCIIMFCLIFLVLTRGLSFFQGITNSFKSTYLETPLVSLGQRLCKQHRLLPDVADWCCLFCSHPCHHDMDTAAAKMQPFHMKLAMQSNVAIHVIMIVMMWIHAATFPHET